MKMIQVVNALPTLQKLASCELTLKTLYRINKLLGNLENEVAFYNEHREKMLAKYCEVVDNRYVPRAEDEAKLNAELNELLGTEIDTQITEVVLSIDEDVKLSYNDLVALEGFVRIEGE